jgi:translocation and assembly module TamB
MRRIAKFLFLLIAGVLAAVLLMLAVVLFGANTPPGRNVLAWLVPRLTGGEVRVEGLSGSFPSALHVRALTLADASGPYLTGRDVAVDWRPLRLLHGAIAVDRLTAAEIDLLRLPTESGKSSSKPTPASTFPPPSPARPPASPSAARLPKAPTAPNRSRSTRAASAASAAPTA